jgi:hypothetical protein
MTTRRKGVGLQLSGSLPSVQSRHISDVLQLLQHGLEASSVSGVLWVAGKSARYLSHSVRGRMLGNAEQVSPEGLDLDDECDIQPLQYHGVDVEEADREQAVGLGSQEGAPARFCLARRRMNVTSSSPIGGRPGGLLVHVDRTSTSGTLDVPDQLAVGIPLGELSQNRDGAVHRDRGARQSGVHRPQGRTVAAHSVSRAAWSSGSGGDEMISRFAAGVEIPVEACDAVGFLE